jgi:hypothetical protein
MGVNIDLVSSHLSRNEHQLVANRLLRQYLAEQQAMLAQDDATTLTVRFEAVTYKIAVKEMLEKTKGELSVDNSKQPAITFEIAPGVSFVIDSIYGTPAVWVQRASGLFCSNRLSAAKPCRKIRLGARRIGALAGGGFFRVVQPLAVNPLRRFNRRE